jgi:hypothetical protein
MLDFSSSPPVPRKRKINIADPLDFDHEADAESYAYVHDLPGGDVLLTPADLAKRWRTTVDALRKQRERGTGPPLVCMNARVIRYRLLDVVNFEANRAAYSVPQARSIGLLCITALALTIVMLEHDRAPVMLETMLGGPAASLSRERAVPQISFASVEQKPLWALSDPAGAEAWWPPVTSRAA